MVCLWLLCRRPTSLVLLVHLQLVWLLIWPLARISTLKAHHAMVVVHVSLNPSLLQLSLTVWKVCSYLKKPLANSTARGLWAATAAGWTGNLTKTWLLKPLVTTAQLLWLALSLLLLLLASWPLVGHLLALLLWLPQTQALWTSTLVTPSLSLAFTLSTHKTAKPTALTSCVTSLLSKLLLLLLVLLVLWLCPLLWLLLASSRTCLSLALLLLPLWLSSTAQAWFLHKTSSCTAMPLHWPWPI